MRSVFVGLRGRRIVVTGAGGFIGSRLVESLRNADCEILRVLRAAGEPPAAATARITDIIGDVRDRDLWEDVLSGVDVVYHLAAQTSAVIAEGAPEEDFQQNVLPMLHLLEGCRRSRLRPSIIFASTATICGLPDRLPVDETFPDRPITVYDLHKKMAEDYLKHYVRSGAARGAALRFANIYGPGPLRRGKDRGVLDQMISRALDGKPLTIYGAGDLLRDYTYIDDAVRALLAAARHMEELNGGHVVVGSGQGHAVAEAIHLVAARVSARTGREVTVSSVPPPASMLSIDTRNFVADPRMFREATGWTAEVSLAEGIDRAIEVAIGQTLDDTH